MMTNVAKSVDSSVVSADIVVQLCDFALGAIRKTPENTFGVWDEFYYGTIDGIELGGAYDTKAECLADMKSYLNGAATGNAAIYLTEILEDAIDWIKATVPQCHPEQADVKQRLELELAQKEALLTKVLRYQATLPTQIA